MVRKGDRSVKQHKKILFLIPFECSSVQENNFETIYGFKIILNRLPEFQF